MTQSKTNFSNVNEIIAPESGKTHIVSVQVDDSRAWGNAVRAAGPSIANDWEIWGVGNYYPPVENAKSSLKQVILVDFCKYMRIKDVLNWGKIHNLYPASPRSIFAIGEYYPNLNRDLDEKYTNIISLVPCRFGKGLRVPFIVLDELGCVTGLLYCSDGGFDAGWFAFVHREKTTSFGHLVGLEK